MTRQQIIADLMTCLAAIKPANGFSLTPQSLRRGLHLASQASAFPALSLFNERVTTVEETGGAAERVLTLHLWGAARAPQDDFSQLDNLAAACVEALNRPDLNPHWQSASIERIDIYEGGASDPLGLFDLVFSLRYQAPLDTL